MTDQELLQAIGRVVEAAVEAKLEPVRRDILELKDGFRHLEARMDQLEARMDHMETKMAGVRVYMDTELQQSLNLLLEGQQALWDRFVPHEELDPLEDRTQLLELTVRRHSQEIKALQYA